MKPKTLEQIEEMKKQTIGVELEFTGITRAKAADVVARYFNTSAHYDGGAYRKWDIRDQQGRKWQVMYDSGCGMLDDVYENRLNALIEATVEYADSDAPELDAETEDMWDYYEKEDELYDQEEEEEDYYEEDEYEEEWED